MSRRVVKRKKHTESFQRTKLEKSIMHACLGARDLSGAAELTAMNVCNKVEAWLEDKLEVTSHDLRLISGQYLSAYNPAAALVYVTHMNVN